MKVKHALIAGFSLFVFMAVLSEKNHKTDWEDMKLKGSVKSVKTTTYNAMEKFGEVTNGEKQGEETYVVFNKEGNKIEEYKYNPDGSLKLKITYKYDEKRNKIEENRYNKNEELESKTLYKYDERGNKVEENVFGNFDVLTLLYKDAYKYDEKGNKIEEIRYSSNGDFESKITYKYDEKGNKIEAQWYDENERKESKIIYKYDKKRNKIEENEYLSEGELGSQKIYKYDEKRNKIEESDYDAKGRLITKWTYKYDKEGNVIEENEHEYGEVFFKKAYKYEFDKYNNWTRIIEYHNNKPKYVTERTIKYFK